jgi:hypothetical protein
MSRLILPRRALLKTGAAVLITSPAIIRKAIAQVGQIPGYPPTQPVISGLDPATTAWINAVTTAGGTVSTTQQGRVDTLIKALKTDVTGNLFNLSDRLFLFAGESVSAQARTDIKTATTVSPTATPPTLSATGYTGNTTSMWFDTGWKPSTGPNWARNAASVVWYLKTAADVNHSWFGAVDTGGAVGINANHTNGTNLNNGFASGFSLTVNGQHIINRTVSTGYDHSVNEGTYTTAADASNATIVNNNMFVCSSGSFSGTPNSWSSDNIMSIAFGAYSNTQATAVAHIINAYMTAWGVNTY